LTPQPMGWPVTSVVEGKRFSASLAEREAVWGRSRSASALGVHTN
jgi:hypothetical protein